MKSLMNSITAQNLITEFRKKTYCQQRYSNYESIAIEQHYMEISDMFRNMARNCNEHARIIARFLICNGYSSDQICSLSQPPIFCSDTLTNMQTTARDEAKNVLVIFPQYVKTAYDEGYLEVAVMLYNMSTVSENYGRMCSEKINLIKNDTYTQKLEPQNWICSRCGYIYSGYSAPEKCPLCAKEKNYFSIIN